MFMRFSSVEGFSYSEVLLCFAIILMFIHRGICPFIFIVIPALFQPPCTVMCFSAALQSSLPLSVTTMSDIYNMWFARSIANRLSRAVLRCFPILFVAAFIPYPYGIAAPGKKKSIFSCQTRSSYNKFVSKKNSLQTYSFFVRQKDNSKHPFRRFFFHHAGSSRNQVQR